MSNTHHHRTAPLTPRPGATTTRRLGAAGSQLSTAPQEDAPGRARHGRHRLGPLVLAAAHLDAGRAAPAVPAVARRDPRLADPADRRRTRLKVADFKRAAQHRSRRSTRSSQLFDVYSSVWFSAIYILLFVSLIGCIVPRTWQFVGQLRGRPPGAPRRLTRLPAYTTWRTEAEPEQVREAALGLLRKRRFRAHSPGTRSPPRRAICARSATSLFHIALIVMLIAFACGPALQVRGRQADRRGRRLLQHAHPVRRLQVRHASSTPTTSTPFSFDLEDFDGTYERERPAARHARAPTRPTSPTAEGADGKDEEAHHQGQRAARGRRHEGLPQRPRLRPRHHRPGRQGQGRLQAAPCLCCRIDNNVTSTGAIKVMDGYRDANGVEGPARLPGLLRADVRR